LQALFGLKLLPHLEPDALVDELIRDGRLEIDLARLVEPDFHHLVVKTGKALEIDGSEALVYGVASIGEASPLDFRDLRLKLLFSHLRIVFADQGIGLLAVAVEVVVPSNDRGIDEALHQVRVVLDEFTARLDDVRVGSPAVVGQHEYVGLNVST